MTALDDLRNWARIIESSKRTIYCRPGQEDAVREAVALSGQSTWFNVQPCDTVPDGAVFIVEGQP